MIKIVLIICILLLTILYFKKSQENLFYDENTFQTLKTQEKILDDLQQLYKHCNDQKKSDIKKYNTSHLPPPYLFFLLKEKEIINEGNHLTPFKNEIQYTFWYDPIQYTKMIVKNYILNFIKPILYEYFNQCKNPDELFDIIKSKIDSI